MKLTSTRIWIAGFVVSLALLGGVAWVNRAHTDQMQKTADQISQAERVRWALARLLSQIQDVETGARGFVMTGDPTFLEAFKTAAASVHDHYLEVCALTADNPNQTANGKALEPLINQRIALSRSGVKLRQTDGFEAARLAVASGAGKAVMDRIRGVIATMNAEEATLLSQRQSLAKRENHNANVLTTIGTGLSFTVLTAVFAFVLRENRLRRKSEHSLQANRAELETAIRANQLIMDNSLDVICTIDEEGRFAFLSSACEKFWGYSPSELIGQEYIKLVHPDDHAKTNQAAADIMAGKPLSDFENRYRRKDGSLIPVVWSSSWSAKDRIMFCVAHDITERLRKDEVIQQLNTELQQHATRLQSLFESLPGLYLVLTPDLVITAASDAYLKATMTTRESILGRKQFDAFPDNPDDTTANGAANLLASFNRVKQLAAPDTMAIQRYDIRRPDGVFEERFWSPVNSPVLNADGRVEYIIHRVEDVTDFVRKKSPHSAPDLGLHARLEQMEVEVYQRSQEIQSMMDRLRIANEELESFSYSVSHDLRAPLRHIEGFSGMLSKHAANTLDERGQRYLKVIADSARGMGVLIDDLLTFARIGRAELRRLPVRLDELVQDVRQSMASEINGRQIEWALHPLPIVQGDPNLLRQVFSNLIGNAVKYTGRKPAAHITIATAPSDHAGEIVISVSDNGAGFDMKYENKLFGVFQRLHTATEFEGNGVGLANVRRIIQRHGGRTWAKGEPDKGATFYFSLPHDSNPAMTTPSTTEI